jgi:hypothetical protein
MNSTADMPNKITADEINVEVVDKDTGKTYVRKLPVNYLETSNFLRLSAEDSQGNPSSLVFYTEQGILGLRDMTGGGPDTHRCEDHRE